MSHTRLSAFVVSYNRAPIIGTCLRSLRFADEVIVVDKSSSDATPDIAASLADRVIGVPWSPTVEETRAFAAAQCAHEWILFLDDDECLSPKAGGFLQRELADPSAEAYAFPLRHYILGRHDEAAYYWPEHHIRLFRRGALSFGGTVHAGLACEGRVRRIGAETGVCIHHLSHQDAAQWIEKANRYTSCPDRARVTDAGQDLRRFAHDRIEHWFGRTRDPAHAGYPSTVALLRAVYDQIDRVKLWEEEHGIDGAAAFQAVCQQLDAAYGERPARTASRGSAQPPCPAPPDPAAVLRRSLGTLRAEHEAVMRRLGDVEHRATSAEAERDSAQAAARAAVEAAEAANLRAGAAEARADQAIAAMRRIEASTCWRATAWPRRMIGQLRNRG